jgi:hypothetical protein
VLSITLDDLERVCELDPITIAEQAEHSVDGLIVTRVLPRSSDLLT